MSERLEHHRHAALQLLLPALQLILAAPAQQIVLSGRLYWAAGVEVDRQ